MRTVLVELEEAGVNVPEALEQIGGDEEVYLYVLRRFANDRGIDSLVKAFEKNDMGNAFDVAHTLKGMYASIYFQREFEICSEIVELLRDNDGNAAEAATKLEVLNRLHRQKLGIMKGRID